MDKDTVFGKLLCYGFFPNKLDEFFQSKDFGDWIIKNEKKPIPKKITFEERYYKVLNYKSTRNDNSPRYLGCPNPIGYFHLAQHIQKNWNKIEERMHCALGYKNISMIRPNFDNKNKRLFSLDSYDKNSEQEQLHLTKQFGKKYYVKADISSCFPSIYTHAISWALVGKNVAKENKTESRQWQNKLDKACMRIQDGETRGIPIGPDSSAILGELILSQIDKKLEKYDYLRYVDDYKCYCKTEQEADNFINDLANALEEYRLQLNTKKTSISTLPQPLNEHWVRELKSVFHPERAPSEREIINLIDLSSDLLIKNPNKSSVRYAVTIIQKKRLTNYKNFKIIFTYIFNLCVLHPYIVDLCDKIIDYALEAFPKYREEIKKEALKLIRTLFEEHLPYSRSDVIAWSLFLAIKYDLCISDFSKFSKKILKNKDPIPALICYLYSKKNGLDPFEFTGLIDQVDKDEWWLYVYEVSRIENKELKDDSEMEKLRKAGVSFLGEILKTSVHMPF